MYPAVYHIKMWDEIEMKEREVCGITFAKNYVEAVQNMEDYYGDTIISFSIMFVDTEQSIVEISKEEAERLERNA